MILFFSVLKWLRLSNKHSIVQQETSHKILHDHVFVLVQKSKSFFFFYSHKQHKKEIQKFIQIFFYSNKFTHGIFKSMLKISKYLAAKKEALVEIDFGKICVILIKSTCILFLMFFNAETPNNCVNAYHTTKKYCELNASEYNVILNTSHSGLLDFKRVFWARATFEYTPNTNTCAMDKQITP